LVGPRIANIESRPLSSPPSLFPITLHASLLSRNPNYLPDTFIFIMSDQHRADSIPSRSTLRVGERRASVLLARRRSAARSDCQVQPFLLPPPHVIASEQSERSNLTLHDRSSAPKTLRLLHDCLKNILSLPLLVFFPEPPRKSARVRVLLFWSFHKWSGSWASSCSRHRPRRRERISELGFIKSFSIDCIDPDSRFSTLDFRISNPEQCQDAPAQQPIHC